MLLRIGQVLMLLVLFAAAGGHWMALQSLAWTRMLVSYAEGGPLVEAVAKTFDGRHPCTLCKKIERATKGELPSRVTQQENQACFLVPPLAAVIKNAGASWQLEIPQKRLGLRFHRVITPPPRGAVA
jgi:hypothetical protein